MELWTALGIGFFGSFHCIGMCGPIALALPGSNDSTLSLVVGRVLYNVGRICTYSFLGIIFGLIGHSIALAGFQQTISVVLGLAIIAGTVLRNKSTRKLKEKAGIEIFYNRLRETISAQFKKHGLGSLFIIGVLNGLLPCGFVYVGLAGSITTGSVWEGSLFMALFGAGTFPAMLAMSLAPGFISLSVRKRLNSIIPYLAVGFGLYLVYRGIAFEKMLH